MPYTRARTNWKPTPHLAVTAGQPNLDKMVKRTLPATDEVSGRKRESILEDLSRSEANENTFRDVSPIAHAQDRTTRSSARRMVLPKSAPSL